MIKAAQLECDFVPSIAYLEWCGIKLDENKWRNKMINDKSNIGIIFFIIKSLHRLLQEPILWYLILCHLSRS